MAEAGAGDLFVLPPAGPEEDFQPLLEGRAFTLERIVSRGHASPPGFWYDQPRDEWVVVLQGEAKVRIEGEAEARHLRPGQWLLLPARCRHRVEWTDPDGETVWLALHFEG